MNYFSTFQQVLKLIHREQYPVLPLFLLFLFIIAGIFAPLLVLHNPTEVALGRMLVPPFFQTGGNIAFPFGTDQLGRDILSRIIIGARTSLIIAITVIFLAGVFGTALGLVAGYLGRAVDTILMKLTDAQLSVPLILLAIIVIGVFGASLPTIVVVIAITAWPRYARLIRSEALVLREEDFVALAKVAGAGHLRIMLKHILPNVLPSLIVLVTLDIPRVILFESALSFLGLGIQPPIPSWGGMIAEGRAYLESAWWLTALPGVILVVTSMSANLVGDWMRDRLDPSLQL